MCFCTMTRSAIFQKTVQVKVLKKDTDLYHLLYINHSHQHFKQLLSDRSNDAGGCTVNVYIQTACSVIVAVFFYISLQVNLDFYTRELISQSLQQPSPPYFVVAQRKIYSVLENDSFPCLIQFEQCKVLFDAASKQRGLRKDRKALKIRSTGYLMLHDSKPQFKTNQFAV